MKITSGIDIGKNGSVVIFHDNKPLKTYDMPCPKKHVDLDVLTQILKYEEVEQAVIEKVGASPRMGVSSAFNFGCNFYGVCGVCAGLGIPFHLITPQRWKTYCGLIGKPKDASRTLCIDKFPHLTDELKRKKDVDRADAILIGLTWLELEGRK
jgi:crossover junction endodeoxyribonuclease RuvC